VATDFQKYRAEVRNAGYRLNQKDKKRVINGRGENWSRKKEAYTNVDAVWESNVPVETVTSNNNTVPAHKTNNPT